MSGSSARLVCLALAPVWPLLRRTDPLSSLYFGIYVIPPPYLRALPYNACGEPLRVSPTRPAAVAYVKYDRASSAALAMEHLNGAVLNNGRGPKLKVLLAEAPTPR